MTPGPELDTGRAFGTRDVRRHQLRQIDHMLVQVVAAMGSVAAFYVAIGGFPAPIEVLKFFLGACALGTAIGLPLMVGRAVRVGHLLDEPLSGQPIPVRVERVTAARFDEIPMAGYVPGQELPMRWTRPVVSVSDAADPAPGATWLDLPLLTSTRRARRVLVPGQEGMLYLSHSDAIEARDWTDLVVRGGAEVAVLRVGDTAVWSAVRPLELMRRRRRLNRRTRPGA